MFSVGKGRQVLRQVVHESWLSGFTLPLPQFWGHRRGWKSNDFRESLHVWHRLGVHRAVLFWWEVQGGGREDLSPCEPLDHV